jgi:hypothetical protein
MDQQERIDLLEEDLIDLISGKVKDIEELKSLTKEMVNKLLEEGMPLKLMPERLVDKQVYLDSVELDPRNICLVPDEYSSPELIASALKENGMLLDAIDEKLLTKDLCEVAIKQNASAIWIVPDSLITRGLCKRAIEGGAELNVIPVDFRSEMEEYKGSLNK